MTVFSALRSSVSGLFAQSQAIGAVADNIANLSTTGYKAVSARFSTLVTTQASANSFSPGGVQFNLLNAIDQQGLLETSSSETDIAISGNGFFVVSDNPASNNGAISFTRAGAFRADANGNLANTAGQFLTGFPIVNGTVQQTSILSALTTVNISNLTSQPTPTTTINIGANLPANASTGDAFNLSVETLNKQGSANTLVLTFTKTATTDQWNVSATISNASFLDIDADNDGAATDNALIAGTTSTQIGTITFSANGALATVTASTAGGDIATVSTNNQFVFEIDSDNSLTTGTAADRVPVTLNLGTLGVANGLTQFAGNFVPNFITQNGRLSGSITGVAFAENGTVTALFDTGETRDIFQVPLAIFPNPNGLTALSGNLFTANSIAGTPVALVAGTGAAGIIAANALEASTVDLASEFTNLIVAQRAFSANTKIITTADELLEELTRIIR
jgi:flagellar hook protein FlgE